MSWGSLAGALLQILREPSRRERDDLVERARLLEQMRRAGNDLQARRTGELGHGAAVQLDHDGVALPDDQQRRRQNAGEGIRREIRPAAPRDDGGDQLRPSRGRGQRRGRARAGPEEPNREIGRAFLLLDPIERLFEPPGQQRDIEDLVAIAGFARQQEVEQQRGEPGLVERASNLSIARAQPTGSAAVGEEDDAARSVRNRQQSLEPQGKDLDVLRAGQRRPLLSFLVTGYVPCESGDFAQVLDAPRTRRRCLTITAMPLALLDADQPRLLPQADICASIVALAPEKKVA